MAGQRGLAGAGRAAGASRRADAAPAAAGPAAAGQNAGVSLGFKGSMDSPIEGEATLTEAQAADVAALRERWARFRAEQSERVARETLP